MKRLALILTEVLCWDSRLTCGSRFGKKSSKLPQNSVETTKGVSGGGGGHFLQRLATLSVSTPLVSALDLKVYTKDELPFLDWVPCACQQLPPRLQSRMQAGGAVVWGTHYDSTHASNLGCEGNHGLACSYDVGSRKE